MFSVAADNTFDQFWFISPTDLFQSREHSPCEVMTQHLSWFKIRTWGNITFFSHSLVDLLYLCALGHEHRSGSVFF